MTLGIGKGKRLYSQAVYSQNDSGTKKTRTMRKKADSKPKMSSSMLARAVRREIYKQSETKHVNIIGDEVSLSTIASGTGLPLISQPYPAVGPEPNERIGNKIQPVGFSFKAVYWNQYSYPVMVRRMIIKVQDGTLTNTEILSNLFEGVTANVDASDNGAMQFLLRKVNREGFVCLKDDLITLGINNGGSSLVSDKTYVKLAGSQSYRENAATHAMNDRIVVIHLAREGDGDESTGSTIEFSYA